jgi:hypothetical protein
MVGLGGGWVVKMNWLGYLWLCMFCGEVWGR